MSRRSSVLVLAAAAWLTAHPAAQVWQPDSSAKAVSAATRDWYRDRLPIFFAGDLYYPAGPVRHFDADVMVRTGSFDGIVLFADTSIEPYSEILVPVGGGLVRPYERRRDEELAGTTGSRAPGFPVRAAVDASAHDITADTQPWPGRYEQAAPPPAAPRGDQAPVADAGRIATARAPEGNRGIWIRYEGTRWESAGEAVGLDDSLKVVGRYRGFPVYARSSGAAPYDVIFIPTREAIVAPYRKAAQ